MKKLTRSFILILLCWLHFSSAHSASLDWHPVEDGSGGELRGLKAGTAIGLHNGMLIVAGGRRPDSTENSLGADYSNAIHVASRTEVSATTVESIRTQNSILNWQATSQKLPKKLAYSAFAANELGVFVVGGTDGINHLQDSYLLRWNEKTLQVQVYVLPRVPGVVVNGSAVVIENQLYVVSGSDGQTTYGDLFMLDLSQIAVESSGAPVAKAGAVEFRNTQGGGVSANPWRRLPSMPDSVIDSPAGVSVFAVAQSNGREDQLYVLRTAQAGAQVSLQNTTDFWSFGFGEDGLGRWVRKEDVTDPAVTRLQSFSAMTPFGASHILLLPHRIPGGDSSPALFYNAITDAWVDYSAEHTGRLLGRESSSVELAGSSGSLLTWGDDLLFVSPSTEAEVPAIWSIEVRGSELYFGWQNMTILVLYLLAVVLVGIYFAFKNNSTEDYFRGGQHIPWWAAACSIYATMLSSLTYVALPSLVYRTDWRIYLGAMMIAVVAPLAIYVAMPFFRQINATSAYEYLSKRFNMPVRLLASALFALFHVGRMGIVMALTALALSAVTPLGAWECVLIMGVLCLIYCTLGGVEAVIWTDTIQTVVLLVGAVICFSYILNGIDGGFAGFVESGIAGNKFRMVDLDFGLDSMATLSIWVIVLGGIGQNISSYTADQAIVQRYMVTNDQKAAAKSIWANAVMAVPGALLFFCIGTGLYGFYQTNPEKLDPTIQIDQIFPSFIATELPVGVAGLIVAGIFAAAQSTVSTSMNSIATTVVTDFMRPFNLCHSEKGYFNAARWLTFTMGVLGSLAALIFINPDIRSLMEEYFVVIGMFMGALGGLFVLGVTSKKANGWGAMIGLFAGVGLMLLTWLTQWADGYLFATIGILTCLLVGYVASILFPAPARDLTGLTLYTMRSDDPAKTQ